jgi:23S rRNA (cytidine1920-2'-O)/16S rRNA (cytidine1409-2'-O)-methyltransferase
MLVVLGHFASRASAQAAIAAGRVRADGRILQRPAERIARTALIEAIPAHPFVSRGGLKLSHALEHFAISPVGWSCLDLGASTGGFTDVLLRAGAGHVTCVDVGHGQLHPSLATDSRVVLHEGLNVRDLAMAHLPGPADLIVCDLSFVSLAKVLSPALHLAARGAGLVALFKPQFEVGRAYVGKGGIVSDPEATARALQAFLGFLQTSGWIPEEPVVSPVCGGDGNREFLVHARNRV